MKTPISILHLGAAALVCPAFLVSAAFGSVPDADLPAVYESYDKNPLGDMVGNPSGGYGVTGNYNLQGAASTGAFQIVAGGLDFGSFNVVGSGSKCVQVNANGTATGAGILVDGGKTWGDTDFFFYDKLYCSYLVNFTNVSTSANARAEVRTSTSSTSTGAGNFQIHMDQAAVSQAAALLSPPPTPTATTGGANTIQPALSYTGTTYNRVTQNPVDNSLLLNTTYLMIGRFNSAGNALSVTQNSTWTSGSNTITVAANTGITVGMLANGAGIALNSIVTGISGTTVTLNKETTAPSGDPNTPVGFRFIIGDSSLAAGVYSNGVSTMTVNSVSGAITNGMYVLGTGIPANTIVNNYNPTTGVINLSAPTTAEALSPGVLVRFRSVAPITANWSNGVNTITVSRNPGIQVGQVVQGDGLPANATVIDIDGNTITLNGLTTAPGSAAVVNFLQRSGTSSLFALTLPQYQSMLAAASTEFDRNNYLDITPIGRGSNQISVKITGTPAITGSIEFGHGRYIHLYAQGATNSNETYKLDELRYGMTLRSVTQPATFQMVPPNDVAAFDDMENLYYLYTDSGYGWKSGRYVVEETASPQGATISISDAGPGSELVPGGGDYLNVDTRTALSNDQGIRRRPDPAVIDMTKPYTMTFDYQMSSVGVFNQFADRIQIGADGTGGTAPNLGPNPAMGTSNITWMIGVVGNKEIDARLFFPGRWYFYNQTGKTLNDAGANYFVQENMVLASDDADGGPDDDPDNDFIPALSGNVYSFKIEVNPQAFSYRATIYDRGTITSPYPVPKKFSKGGLKFRENGNAHSVFWGISKGTNEPRSFALDNVRMVQGVDFFPEWIASYPSVTVAGDKVRIADPDKDGQTNFLEYALDGDPSTGNASGKVTTGVTTISTNQYHTLTLPVRTGLTFTAGTAADIGDQLSSFTTTEGIKYKIEGSYDLINWNADVVEMTALATTPVLNASPGWTYKTFRLAQPISATHPKGFLRAMVETTK